MGKIYNALYNALSTFDSFMSTLGQDRVDAVTSAAPTALQAIKQDPGIARRAQATAEGIPTVVLGSESKPSAKPLAEPTTPTYGDSAYSSNPVKADVFDFLNADLAKHYGMTKATAYQEALANTAYQRAVKDMKAAGLNPAVMFGSGRAQSANASVHATEARSGSGGYSRSGGSNNYGKLFSSSAYGAISSISGLITSIATHNPGNYWVGSSVAQGAMNLMNALSGR